MPISRGMNWIFEKNTVAGRTFVIVGAAGLLVTSVFLLFGYFELKKHINEDHRSSLTQKTDLVARRYEREIERVKMDLEILAGIPPFQGLMRAMNNGGVDPLDPTTEDQWKNRLEITLAAFASKPHYAEIRLIGVANNGKEIARVDRYTGKVAVIPQRELQEKADRDYFQEGVMLAENDYHIGPPSVRIDNGKVIEPIIYQVRVIKPIYWKNNVFALLVINLNFNYFIQELHLQENAISVLDESRQIIFHPSGFESIQETLSVVEAKSSYDNKNTERYLRFLTEFREPPIDKTELWHLSAILVLFLLVALITHAFLKRVLAPLKNINDSILKEDFSLALDSKVLLDPTEVGNLARSLKTARDKEIVTQKELALERIKTIQQAKLASLGEMSAGIAHEINNPLAIISGTAPLLRKYKNDEAKLESKIETIVKSTERIAKIVRGLKKFSRTSEGGCFKREKLNQVIAESLILTEAKSNRYSTPVKIDVPDYLEIHCDQIEIEQVFVNLINNGIDAVKTLQDKWISIKAFEENQQVVVQVTDSGHGISSDIEEKLFQPFYTTKIVGEGTGLGLSISKGILDGHKASISINRNFKNTCFEIRFPKAESVEIKHAT